MITVGPSSLNVPDHCRWCLKEADDYLVDVILECKRRFNIDPDRVFLLGHSMGGFGAYHHALRQPDRFAAVVVNSGSWNMAYWPAVRGTPLCLVNGAHDAHPDKGDGKGHRSHYTDVEYLRQTRQILAHHDIQYVAFEHDGGHAFGSGKKYVFQYFRSARDLRRDPFFDHVGLASPAGFRKPYRSPVRHNRWLSLDEAVKGDLEYERLIPHNERSFTNFRLEYRKAKYGGASLDAVNRHDNTIVVTTRNVARFTVWLHPRMVERFTARDGPGGRQGPFPGASRAFAGHGPGVLRAPPRLGPDLPDESGCRFAVRGGVGAAIDGDGTGCENGPSIGGPESRFGHNFQSRAHALRGHALVGRSAAQ